ncbi:MAG: acyl-CoA thioester hydrolase/BAAT C-terminal domain-containing protein [Caulobacteraceae bacterium]
MKLTALLATVAAVFLIGSPGRTQVPGIPKPVLTDPGPTGARVNQPGVFGNYFAARGAGRHPAILLLGGSEGGLGLGATREAKALQAQGFSVLDVSYFGAPGQPANLANVPAETFSRAITWLQARPDVAPTHIGIVGGSKGAEAALLAASRDPRIKAVVVGMPSSVVWPGISYTRTMQPSWTEGGQPVPFLPYAFGSDYRNIYGAYDNGLKALAAHPDAVIPVERINGPVMLVCGMADILWPSCPMSDEIVARLKAKGFRRKVELLRYANAGHAVFGPPVDPSNPAYPTLGSLGGTADGNNAARKDDWPRAVAFLRAALGA